MSFVCVLIDIWSNISSQFNNFGTNYKREQRVHLKHRKGVLYSINMSKGKLIKQWMTLSSSSLSEVFSGILLFFKNKCGALHIPYLNPCLQWCLKCRFIYNIKAKTRYQASCFFMKIKSNINPESSCIRIQYKYSWVVIVPGCIFNFW